MKRVVIKIGSNVLTRPDGMLDITRMSAIVDQVAELRRAGIEVILVSSGAVASGRGELRGAVDTTRLDDLSARQLFSAVGQAKLINRYYEFFREHGIHCGQVLATKENFARRAGYLNQQHCMSAMLAHGVIPIVNENDTVSLTELMFTDNDELSGLIATMMSADRLIILSNIDGLYTGDPADPASTLIARVEPGDDPSEHVAASRSSLGRGGMVSKCRIAMRVASEGIDVVVANGKREGVLPPLAGIDTTSVPHTLFAASASAASGVKKWIAHSDAFAKGVMRVNDGAAEALRRGASLLAVGVESIEGDFDADDIVTVAAPDGTVIAWGRSSLDAAQARSLTGVAGVKPLIHADYLYVDTSSNQK
ncbi:MAG: glutamate 5-kinase [Muribaculaceae bacterium]|nr:glutamate 5-kinase [Muribaculaceae bacterium]